MWVIPEYDILGPKMPLTQELYRAHIDERQLRSSVPLRGVFYDSVFIDDVEPNVWVNGRNLVEAHLELSLSELLTVHTKLVSQLFGDVAIQRRLGLLEGIC